MKKHLCLKTVPLFIFAALIHPASGQTVLPFTEDFDLNNSNWTDPSGIPMNWISSGGVSGAGDGYITSAVNFSTSFENDNVLFSRGQAASGASGGAFAGDWLSSGISEFSFWVRHDFTDPLTFFTRFATPANFPGVAGLSLVPVMPNTWTQVTFSIDAGNPLMFPEGPPGTFEAAFGNIGNLQLGLVVPLGLAGYAPDVNFDVDAISVIPAPGSGLLLVMSGVFFSRGRRRRE